MNDSLLESANKSIQDFFDADVTEYDEKGYGRIYQKASIGVRVRHDFIVNSRIEVDQKLRIIGMAFNDPKVREEYTRATLPQMLPDLQSRPIKK